MKNLSFIFYLILNLLPGTTIAQEDYKKVDHSFSISYGPSWVDTKVYDAVDDRTFTSRFGQEIGLEYKCNFMLNEYWGLGFGTLGTYTRTRFPKWTTNELLLIPEFTTFIYSPDKKWKLNGSIGFGAGRLNDNERTKWGMGSNLSAGAEYQINRHLGIATEFAINGENYFYTSNRYEDGAITHYAIRFALRYHL